MDEENINISFTDFESVSINTMKELWQDKDFTDVTLATSDGRRQLKAHKIILSSASSVFNNILLQHKHQNPPLIFLHDIHLGMLEKILEFIYTGRCEIHQDDLKLFLSCGTALGIHRLVESKDETTNIFKVEMKKTVLESDPHLNTGTIIALEKGADEEHSENMGHLRMNTVDLEQIKTLSSQDKRNELDKSAYEDTNIQMVTVDVAQIKTNGSEDKTLSVPNHFSGDLTEGVIIPCKSCDKTFISRNSLRRHMRRHQKVTLQRAKRFCCTICDFKTYRPCQLRDHEDGHAGKVFKCNECDAVAKSRGSLKGHIKTMHGVPFSCTQCEFKSRGRPSMNNHRETMHEANTYKCDQCAFDTKSRISLGQHKAKVHSEVTKCNICSYGSKCKESLRWHQKVIHEGLIIKCEICDKTFNSPGILKVHKKAHHNHQKRMYSCNECEFTTTGQKISLYRHEEQAHGTKEHMCERCHYKTKVEHNLKIHINREHLELYHFQCEQCSYSSKQKTHLDIHTKSKHEGESLMCNFCNYKALQSSNLKRHQSTKHRQVKQREVKHFETYDNSDNAL